MGTIFTGSEVLVHNNSPSFQHKMQAQEGKFEVSETWARDCPPVSKSEGLEMADALEAKLTESKPEKGNSVLHACEDSYAMLRQSVGAVTST